jgi:hypothetical protein
VSQECAFREADYHASDVLNRCGYDRLRHNASQLSDATKAVQSKTDAASSLKEDIGKIRTRIEKEVGVEVPSNPVDRDRNLTQCALLIGRKCRGDSDYDQESTTDRSGSSGQNQEARGESRGADKNSRDRRGS